MGPEYNALQEPGEVRGPAHGVPGGRLPQHLRVLGGPRGDVPHRRRPVHPALRLLPDRHRQAASRWTATSRAGSPSRCRRWSCATPRSPASPATTCPTAAPGCTPRRCAPSTSSTPDTGVENLIPDFNGKPDLLRRGVRVAARGARPQRRDGAADLQADPAGVPLRPLARRAHPGPRLRAGHQVQPDPRHGRDPRGGLARRCATCTTPAASWSPSPSTSAPRCGTTRSSGGSSPRSSWSSRPRPRRSASPGVLSGPLVRSSYRAGRLYRQAMDARQGATA